LAQTHPTAPDLSSPKSTLLSLYAALKAGDLPTAKRCFHFADAQQAETFELTATPLWRPLRLMHALHARFGDSADKLFSAASLEKTVDKAVADLNRAEITVNGDKAVVAEAKAAVDPAAETEVTGITLKKENDHWLVVAATFPDISAEIPPAQLPVMRTMRDAVNAACQTTLDRLAKGDFKSAAEAYTAYQSQVQQTVKSAATRTSNK
jgi:hypothetical protein